MTTKDLCYRVILVLATWRGKKLAGTIMYWDSQDLNFTIRYWRKLPTAFPFHWHHVNITGLSDQSSECFLFNL